MLHHIPQSHSNNYQHYCDSGRCWCCHLIEKLTGDLTFHILMQMYNRPRGYSSMQVVG
jgi:hypothetical protein